MKKISTLLLSSLFSFSLLAYDGSRLSVSTFSSNTDLKIEIDGRKVAMQDNSITLSNIAEGQHSIKIYKERRKSGFGNGYGNGNGNSNGNGFGRRQEVIYSGTVFVKRGFHTDIVVNRFGKVFIDERRMERRDAFEYEDDDYVDDGGWNNGYSNVMNARDFDQVKASLRKEWFDNTRIISARFIIENNNFTTAQVKEMIQLFTFDDKKLEVAKLAYRKTVDKQNYYQVNESFTFNGSKEELARFIRESR